MIYQRVIIIVVMIALLVALVTGTAPPEDEVLDLRITEFSTRGSSVLSDGFGGFPDFIEIKNFGDKSVNLLGFGLSDKLDNPYRWIFPEYVIEPGERLVVFASGNNLIDSKGYLHTNFKLGTGDEHIVLSDDVGNELFLVEIRSRIRVDVERDLEIDYSAPGRPNTYEEHLFLASMLYGDIDLEVVEFMPKNTLTLVPGRGQVPYIKLRAKVDLELSDYFLSDRLSDLRRFNFPKGILRAGDIVTIYLDGVGDMDRSTSFRLSDGEILYLSDISGTIGYTFDYSSATNDLLVDSINQLPSPGFISREEYMDALREMYEAVEIGEILPRNRTSYKDYLGNPTDWAVIYNPTDEPIRLDGLFITDNPNRLKRHPLEGTLDPGEEMVLLLSSNENEDEVPFALSAGEIFIISNYDGDILRFVPIPQMRVDHSFIYDPYTGQYKYFVTPRPHRNDDTGYYGYTNPATFSHTGGVVEQDFYLTIGGEGEIRYTLDGSEPTESSKKYVDPIYIADNTVVRTRVYTDGYIPSEVASSSYIYYDRHLPVISISVDPYLMYDPVIGMYSFGPRASEEFPYRGANFWQRIEIPANIEFFENGERQFSQVAGIRIFGAYSRAMDQKAFLVVARNIYSTNSFQADLTNKGFSSYKSFVLRPSGQDGMLVRFRDIFTTELAARESTLLVQGYKICVVYINGEYFGHYNIREKINEHFIVQNTSATDTSSIDLLVANGRVQHGSNTDYLALVDFAARNDLRIEENYQYVKDRVDLENFADFHTISMFISNSDNGNIRFYRDNNGDRKWRWILYDTDWGTNLTHLDSVWHVLHPDGTGSGRAFSNVMLRKLLQNTEFRDLFLTRLGHHYSVTYSQERMKESFYKFAEILRPEIPYNHERWGMRVTTWELYLDWLMYFIEHRHAAFRVMVRDYFRLSEEELIHYGF